MESCGETLKAKAMQRNNSPGFTLVEVLVALVLLGLISVVLFSSFKLGVRAWEVGSVRAGQPSEVEVVQNLLRNQLREARQLPLGPGEPRVDFTFAGSSEELRFSAPMPAHLGMGGYHVAVVSTDGAGMYRNLILRWHTYRPDMSLTDDRWSEPLVLLDGIAGIEIEYFGRGEEEERAVWHETWDHEETLPDLVRLRLSFAATDDRRWPELLVAPRIRHIEEAQ